MKKIFLTLSLISAMCLSACGKEDTSPDVDKYIVTFDSNGGSEVPSQVVEKGNKVKKPEDPTRNGYDFVNWTYQGERWSFIGYVVTEDMTLFANWSNPIDYTITYELNGGTNSSSNPSTYTVEDTITLADPSKTGFSFVGWTLNDETITTIQKGTYGDLTLVATWSINSYNVTVIFSDESKGTVSGSGTYEYNSQITAVAIPNNGYEFEGWYEGTTKKSSSASYTFTMPAYDVALVAQWTPITYNITYELDGGTNSSSNPSTYTVEDTVTLADPSKTGYSFAGWTLSNNPISTIEAGTYGNLTLVATWSINSYNVTVISSDESKGTVSGSGTYEYNSEVTVVATPATDCVFKGWYSDSELTAKVSSDATYRFTMYTSDVSLYAKFWTQAEEEETQIQWNKAHGVIPVVDAENKQVTYGLYPQTVVDDSALLTALNALDDSSINSKNGWYFYNDEYYAKLTASPYRYNSSNVFNNGNTIVDGTIYWFLCEPITWDILSSNDGQYYLLSDVLLDAHCYHTSTSYRTINSSIVYANNYQYSDIRAWLNGYDGSNYSVSDYSNAGFLDVAFALDSSYIQTTTVDNSEATTWSGNNSYACSNTSDKIFLPSYQDYLNSSYGFSTSTITSSTRECKTTDYARARGAEYNTSNSYLLYNGYYWTRSPYDYGSSSAWNVYGDGYLSYGGVDYTGVSVRPSLSLLVL